MPKAFCQITKNKKIRKQKVEIKELKDKNKRFKNNNKKLIM